MRSNDEPEAGVMPGRRIYPVPIRHANFEHAYLVSRQMWTSFAPTTPLPEWNPLPISRCLSRRPQAICSCGMYELRWDERA